MNPDRLTFVDWWASYHWSAIYQVYKLINCDYYLVVGKPYRQLQMMTSWHANAFHTTGPLWGESVNYRYSPHEIPVMRTLSASFDVSLNKPRDTKSGAGDLRHHDVTSPSRCHQISRSFFMKSSDQRTRIRKHWFSILVFCCFCCFKCLIIQQHCTDCSFGIVWHHDICSQCEDNSDPIHFANWNTREDPRIDVE